MARTLASIDVGDSIDLKRLVDEVRASREPVVLRQNGEDVAVLSLVEDGKRPPWRRPSAADYEAFRAAAGGWKGHIDVEQFLKDNAESRRLSTRPPVDL